MTQAELEELPEVDGFGTETRVINGQLVTVPVLHESKVMWNPTDTDPMTVRDADGVRWRIGLVDGVQCRRRVY